MNLRDFARDKPCQVRLPGCDGGGETTVLAHYRLSGVSGIGYKPPDTIGAWACASCHREVDTSGTLGLSRNDRMLALAEGCFRTLNELHKRGYALTEAERLISQEQQ